MTTAYSPLLGLALPVTGELSGTWGTTVNNFITSYLDAAVAGAQTISGSQTAVTLSTTNGISLAQAGGAGVTGSAQYAIINCTGNPAGLLTITAPSTSKAYLVLNSTSTSQNVKVVAAGPTTGVTVGSGQVALIAWDGSDFVLIATTDLTKLSGILPTSKGGTGLTGFTGANNALYSTSSSALTAGTLPPVAGGTGQTSYTNGQLLIGNSTGNTLTKATLTAGTNITITNGAGSITIDAASAVNSFSAGTTGLTPSGVTTGAITLGGTLATTNGGTGLTSFASAGILYASSSSALATNSLFVYDSLGNVGIGVNKPDYKLDVRGAGQFLLDGATNVTPLYLGNNYSMGLSTVKIAFTNTGTTKASINAAVNGFDYMTFNVTNDTERMRIDYSGNLLLGTQVTTGDTRLVVVGKTPLVGEFLYLARFYSTYVDPTQEVFTITSSGLVSAPLWYKYTTASAANVYVDSTGLLTRATSALKYKQDIRDLESINVDLFRAVRYKSKCDRDDQTKDHFGIVADEVHAAGITELVSYGEDGSVEGFQYERFTAVLLKEIQSLRARVAQLEQA